MGFSDSGEYKASCSQNQHMFMLGDTSSITRADVRIVVFHSCTLRVFLCVIIVVIGLGTSVLKYWLRSGRVGNWRTGGVGG